MDNTDSEMIESLNILIPPVRRDYKTSRFGFNPNAINFMSEWRKPKKRIKGGKRIRRSVESSTSLILKKTSDSQVFDRYPAVSYTSIQRPPEAPRDGKCGVKGKPLIKVIVVPNDQPSEGYQSEKNKVNKICYTNNSEDDTAIESRYVYLVVAGRKKDKIYEIKTTESPTPSNTELKDETVNKVFNGDCFKQLIKALNMERKKTNPIHEQVINKEIEMKHVCRCSGCNRQPFHIEEPIQELDSGNKNKVKIYGQLGLTEDDRYILKCSATVDDKPVPTTTFSTVGQKAPDDFVLPQQINTNARPCKEANIQVKAKCAQHKNVCSQARNDPPSTNSCLPSISQSRGISPRRTRESCHRPIESLHDSDMAIRRTQLSDPMLLPCRPAGMTPCRPQLPERIRVPCQPSDRVPRRSLVPECMPNSCRPSDTSSRRSFLPDYIPIPCQPTDGVPRRSLVPECMPPPIPCDMHRRIQQLQRRMLGCPPKNDMPPCRTQQSQCRPDDFPSMNDMSPRRTQQSQRRMEESLSPNEMVPRKTQQSFRRVEESSNEMVPRKTQQSFRKMEESSSPIEMAPRKTQQSFRKMEETPSPNEMAPRKTQQSQRIKDENPPINEMAPRKTQQSQRMMDDNPPINDVAPRRTQQSARRTDDYPPTRDMSPDETSVSANRQSPTRSVKPSRHQSTPKTVLEERYNSQDTQGTQANLNNYNNQDNRESNVNNNFAERAQKPRPAMKDNNTQCTCNCSDSKTNCKLTETQSPMVIISVYPNSELEYNSASVSKNVENKYYEYFPVGLSEGQRHSNPKQIQNKYKGGKPSKGASIGTALRDVVLQEDLLKNRAYIHKSYRVPSRSPTPQNPRRKNLNDQNKMIETRMAKTNASSQIPPKIPHTNKIPVRSNTSRTIKRQESKKMTSSKQKNITPSKTSRNTQVFKSKSKSRSKCSNANQTKSKSIIADKYKKAINERVDKYNRTSPKHNVSAVSINIDSENECYDVSFHRGNYSTNLLVHKTTKQCENRNNSTVNFYPRPKQPMLSEFQTYSVSGTDNFPDNDALTLEAMSKLNPRDSLELSHRHNLRTEIETQTRIEHSVSKDDMRYFAPIKHFTGDNCVICDPLARDKEIQQLLGVSRRVMSSQTTDAKKAMFGNRNFITQQCFSDERECKDILYSNVEFVDSLCSSCCLRKSRCDHLTRPPHRCIKSSVKRVKRTACEKHQVPKPSCPPCIPCPPCPPTPCPCDKIPEKCPEPKKVEKPPKEKPKKVEKPKPEPKVEHTSLYQQLVLNRNIHIFLQVEQFTKQKPICLTKKQYDKVKKAIQSTLSKNKQFYNNPNKSTTKCVESLISIGEVRRKGKQTGCDDRPQTHVEMCQPPVETCSSKSLAKRSWIKECFQKKKKTDQQVETVILYSRDIKNREQSNFKIGARRTVSSIEVRYATVSYSKHITFSSADAFESYFGPLPSDSSLALKDPISIETLFKGHKKSPTPNLGTSSLSCLSEPTCSASPKLFEKPNQAKRPFLKRLMSCLVMRSDKTPMPALMPPKYPPTVDSSFDSYHFSTSLGAIEMSSSLYDTSASFFSNHSVYPKNNKMKRGFLNSMRGFLNNKRS